ncbi:protein of unknown function [Candidatus Promineifilum breve]|uniref:Uncharacterized protein n=1 Tax=Candidatus Promineifilum breve TaxID=1806508 RepID=A0A160T137_9CHLR|nr:hypothetical protein [Candidatus Promineifilum breve]CUS02488.1 protein of unknown function [Candidatus Promineifilum breve]
MEQPQQPNRLRRFVRASIFLLALLALGLLFVDDLRPGGGDPPAARLLPDLPAYRQVEGQTITTYIGALSEGAALLAGQPQLALTVGTLDGVIDCYQEVGGVRARVYSHAERPLEAGLVAIVDEVRINDPDNLFRCVTPAALSLEGAEEMVIEPCAAAFTLVNEDGTFYVVYAASTYTTCRDFCTALEDCAVHTAEELPLG